ncbi:MAG TPA: hypothetical protein G4O04_04505 [Anaerolineae bacterium]|nr:hypothetical protein [Anaerolineae bacterium]HID83610.1 hypothetical protein [Anaerolineales bacterium]HIQ09496.1 hypothetical protein [Anaerolineaceae bacterium]
MADAYIAWEEAQGQVAVPAPTQAVAQPTPTPPTAAPEGYLTFVVNVHGWVHVEQNAATLLRLIDLFQRYGVRGGFYLTAPVARAYAA